MGRSLESPDKVMHDEKDKQGPSTRAADYERSFGSNVVTVLAVVFCAAAIELARRMAIPVPVPFLVLYGSVALAAGYGGRRVGLLSAIPVAAFVIHSSVVGYGPASLTGGPIQIGAGILIGFGIAILIGNRRDNLLYLAKSLERSQQQLIEARDALARRVERKSDQLADATSELVDARMQLQNSVLYSPAAVVIVSNEYEITSINPAGLEMFGLKSLPPELSNVGQFMQYNRFFAEDGHEFVFGEGPLYKALTSGAVTDDFVCRVVLANKTERWLRGCFAPIRIEDNSVTGVTVIFIDITEKLRARVLLKDLVLRVLKAHEDDRSVIAHRLQDDIGQHLVATKMNLHSAALTGNYADPVRDTIGRIDTLMDSVRDWSLELRPAALDDLGLVSALRWYLTSQQRNFDYEIAFEADICDENLTPEITITFFRIVQQAVANVLQHADAQALTIRMYNQDEHLCLAIIDDGRGFEVEQAMLGEGDGGGLGLISMRERANQIGGEFSIVSAPGKGTTVTVCVLNK